MPWQKANDKPLLHCCQENKQEFILLGYNTVTACKEHSYIFIVVKENPICMDCNSETSFWIAQIFFQKGRANKISFDGHFMEISMLLSWEE